MSKSIWRRKHGWLVMAVVTLTTVVVLEFTNHVVFADDTPPPVPVATDDTLQTAAADPLAQSAVALSGVNCGWFSCALKFNWSETRRIADGTIGVAAVIQLCGKGGPWALAACTALGAGLVLAAQSARSQDKCLKVSFYYAAWVPPRPGSWRCSHG